MKTMNMNMRRATKDDRDVVVRLAMEYFKASPYADRFPRANARHMEDLARAVEESGASFIGYCDEQAVGIVSIIIVPFLLTGQPMAQVVLWYCDGRFRSTGLGARLLQLVEGFATTCGVSMLQIALPMGSPAKALLDRRQYATLESTHLKQLPPAPANE